MRFIIFCAMDGASGMLGRRIDRRKLQRAVPAVDNLVPCAARHKDGVSGAELLRDVRLFLTSSHVERCFSCFYTDKLICVRMHLPTYFTTEGDTHESHLQVTSCPNSCAKIPVLLSQLRDPGNKRPGAVIGFTMAAAIPDREIRFHVIHSFLYLIHIMKPAAFR